MFSPPAGSRRPVLVEKLQRLLPARSVVGFALLLAVLFGLSYGAGALVGPVAPAMRPASGSGTDGSGPADDEDMGDMGGMDGMGGVHGMRAPESRVVTPGGPR